MNKFKKIKLIISFLLLFISSTSAKDIEKRIIKSNMNLVYNQLPSDITCLSDMFTNGIFYGRFRSNSFYWDWKHESKGKRKNNKDMGVGGSLIYKSAKYNGLSKYLLEIKHK